MGGKDGYEQKTIIFLKKLALISTPLETKYPSPSTNHFPFLKTIFKNCFFFFFFSFFVSNPKVVGWYHSHPGFGCWLSGVDVNTQQSFEQLNPRSVAVVVDPIQSVRGRVVIDAFRSINTQLLMLGQEPRQTTSNRGHLVMPSIQALIHGLNRHYYSMPIAYRKNELEEKMLTKLNKHKW